MKELDLLGEYMDYYVANVAMKLDFEVRINAPSVPMNDWADYGWGKPDVDGKWIKYHFLWKGIPLLSFERWKEVTK